VDESDVTDISLVTMSMDATEMAASGDQHNHAPAELADDPLFLDTALASGTLHSARRGNGLSGNGMNDNSASGTYPGSLDADLQRAMHDARARSEAERSLPTLTKAELADLLFEQVGLNKREAKDMVDTFFNEIAVSLERGETVKLSGFGNFQLRDKAERPGRNPKTGEEVAITARRVVTFHASQKLKCMMETGTEHEQYNVRDPLA